MTTPMALEMPLRMRRMKTRWPSEVAVLRYAIAQSLKARAMSLAPKQMYPPPPLVSATPLSKLQ